jgi:hypothetical protein
MKSFCLGSQIAGTALKVDRPSTRFTISSEVSTSRPGGIIITDMALGTEVHYSRDSAEQLFNAMARVLGRAVPPTPTLIERPSPRLTNRA